MSASVYKVIELVGTSSDSWEKAAANAVERDIGKELKPEKSRPMTEACAVALVIVDLGSNSIR